MSDPHAHTASSVGTTEAGADPQVHAHAVAHSQVHQVPAGGDEGSHGSHHAAAADDEPETPFWLPALGFVLFVAGGLAWAITPPAQAATPPAWVPPPVQTVVAPQASAAAAAPAPPAPAPPTPPPAPTVMPGGPPRPLAFPPAPSARPAGSAHPLKKRPQ
jgi:hypothetical protein